MAFQNGENQQKTNSRARISGHFRVPGTPEVGLREPKKLRSSSAGWQGLYFRRPGAALSILLRKIQRKQEPKGLRDWCLGSNTPLGRANL